MAVTQAQMKLVLDAVVETGRLIAYKKQVPSGELYAQLMSTGLTLENYEKLIALLIHGGMVAKRGHLLVWVGPDVPLPLPRT